MPRPLDADPFRTAGTLLLLVRSLAQKFREAEDDMDLADLSVLRQIERGRDLPSLVARGLRMDPGRVSRIVDHLERQGFIARQQDQDDRRRWHLQLTSDGTRRLERGKDEIRLAMNALLEGLSDEEVTALELGLESARRQLDSAMPALPDPVQSAP
jgi:DNA-binding MarR family transcriptional regulator